MLKNKLKNALALFLMAASSSMAFAAPASQLPAGVKLQSLDGKEFDPGSIKDKVVVLQFWASWCVGCDKVMSELQERLKDRNDVVFMPVSVDEDVNAAKAWFRHKPQVKALEKCSMIDSSTQLATQLGVTGVPSVAVLSAEGKVVDMAVGHPAKERWDSLEKSIDKSKLSAHH